MDIDYRWLTVVGLFLCRWGTPIGLALDILGALCIAVGVITTKAGAKESTAPKWDGGESQFADRWKQSKWALAGVLLLVVGFGLQLFASWPRG